MDSPIRGRTRELTRKVEATVPMNIHNRFDIEVIDSRTGKIRQRAQAENVICSQLWARLFVPNTYFNYIHYGTGSGTPASTDTSLFTFLGYSTPSTSDDVYSIDSANGIFSLRRKITLSETTAVGSTLTEVGIGYSTASSSLCTHAMLKDMNGNTISILKTSTDIINIYATVFLHYPAAGWDNGSILFTPDVTSITSLTKKLLGLVTGMPSQLTLIASPNPYSSIQANAYSYSTGTITYDIASKKITIPGTRIGASTVLSTVYNTTEHNSDIGLISYGSSEILLCTVPENAWFGHSTITGEAIATGDGVKKDFNTKFGYISSPTIYVDGVAQSTGVTVETGVSRSRASVAYSAVRRITSQGVPVIDRSASGTIYYENTLYQTKKATKIWGFQASAYWSDDLVTWTVMTMSFPTSGAAWCGGAAIPAAFQNKRYFKVTATGSYASFGWIELEGTDDTIHFDTPPTSGAVITMDYISNTIGKDTNHVFDLTITVQLGEYAS